LKLASGVPLRFAAASAEEQRVIKRAWKLKLRADRLVEAERRAKNSTKRR
jgi:hypothetical protein